MLVGVSLAVQVLALSVENQRFFYNKGFRDYFWAEDRWVYFKHSALIERPSEMASLLQGLPATARYFNSVPITEWYTYTSLGLPPGADPKLAPAWMRTFKIFFLPRPWPFWMSYVPPELRPVNIGAWLLGLLSMSVLGAIAIYRGIQIEKCP